MVFQVAGLWRDVHSGRRALGHFVALDHWQGHVLDACAYRHVHGWVDTGIGVRVARAQDALLWIGAGTRRGRVVLGISRPSRRVGLHLGLVYDAAFGAVRRLVAQHLRV